MLQPQLGGRGSLQAQCNRIKTRVPELGKLRALLERGWIVAALGSLGHRTSYATTSNSLHLKLVSWRREQGDEQKARAPGIRLGSPRSRSQAQPGEPMEPVTQALSERQKQNIPKRPKP